MVLLGLAALPADLALVATLPQAAREIAFFAGLAIAAVTCLVGGEKARSAVIAGTTLPVRAWAAAIVGLTAGVTAGLLLVWNLLAAVF